MSRSKKNIRKKKTGHKPIKSTGIGKPFVVIPIAVIALGIIAILFLSWPKENNVRHNPDIQVRKGSELKFDKQGELKFLSPEGEVRASIDIEIADDDFRIARGLMFRDSLAENQGMLFIFPDEDYRSFWMKNTSIPLDMIFVDSDMRIIDIHRFTKPFSEENYHSLEPALYVVEVNAGFADKYHLRIGDKIEWQRIGTGSN